eukprot:15333488-Ditylum_brightwellii.AAC.1
MAKDLANANGMAYTQAQLISIAFSLIFSQGVLNNACRMWPRRTAAEHTWENFIQHFTKAHQELTELQSATQQGGFVANNMELENTNQQTVQALEDLLQATTEDKMTVTNLSTANTNITQQVANLTRNMTKKDTELGAIKQSIDKLTEQLQTLSVGQAQRSTPTPARNQSNRTAGGGRRQAQAGRGNPRQQQSTT